MSLKLGKYFCIKNKYNHLLLSIKNGADVPGAFIVTSPVPGENKYADSQLWFYDPITTTIRSKLNRFCLDINGDDFLIVTPYQRANGNQKWMLGENEIQMMEDFEMVVGLAEASREPGTKVCCVQSETEEWQQWSFEHTPAQFFKLRSKLVSHKLLDVEKAKKTAGAKVIIWTDKGDLADNQLWYEDKNGILRSKLSGFVLDSSNGKDVLLNPYDQSTESQQWYVWGNTIRNRFDKNKVIAVKRGSVPGITLDVVQPEAYDGDANQLWAVEHLPDDNSVWNHGGYGRNFYIRNIQTGLVFTLKSGNLSPMTQVIMCGRKADRHDYDDQLFYIDDVTCTIRAAPNNYCLDMPADVVVINPYDPFSKTQQWKVFGRKIKSKKNPDKVLTVHNPNPDEEEIYENVEEDGDENGCDIVLQSYFGGDLQHFEITHVQAPCFYIRSLSNNKVLDIKADTRSVGAELTLWEPKKTISYNQLWYEDERGILRSRLNGYVIQLSNRGAKTAAYDPGSKDQHYIIVGDRIQNMHNSEQVMEVNTRKGLGALGVLGAVVSGKYDGDTNQKWAFDYV